MYKFICAAALAAAASTPALAQDSGAADKAGLRIEGRVFWERANDPVESERISYELGSGIGYGAEVGYDIAVSESVVVGPYATYDFSTVKDCAPGLCFESDGFWAVGVHAGIRAGDAGQVYAKLGYGQQAVTAEGSFYDPETDVTYTFDERETGGGYNFAFGYEHGFGKTIYGRAEIGISETKDIYGFDFQRGILGVALGARF